MMCVIVSTSISTQAQPSPGKDAVLKGFQDSLLTSAEDIFLAENTIQRFERNARFIRLLVTALKTPGSYDFGFDSLKKVSVVRSPDNAFRIFSWSVPAEQGTYRFFGTVQLRTADGSLRLYPLIDDTLNFSDNNQISDNKHWYGARYYEIIPLEMPGQKICYALLGWKGNNSRTTKKVIEVLSLDEQGLRFGKPLFTGRKNEPARNRIVFEYNKLNSMTLRLDKNEQMIIFDHLVPIDTAMKGNYEYYGSDSSYDGYRLLGNTLKLIENVQPKNDPNALDELYTDPKRKDIPVTKKF